MPNIKIFILLVCCFLSFCTRGAKNTTPNIVWILAEDLSPDLGCYGNELVFTPNVDRLVRWQAEAMDHGMFPDPPALMEHFRQYGVTSEAQHAKRYRELKEQVEKEIKSSGQ
jgi:uncharacterized sulfatase